MILFPAIDLKDGQCVRLKLGDMGQATVYNADPAAQAKAFEEQGFEWLHVVDLNGAFEGRSVNGAAVEAILRRDEEPGAARRRHPHPGSDRELAGEGFGAGDPRHGGGARSGTGQARPAGCFLGRSRSASTPAAARLRSRAGRRHPTLGAIELARNSRAPAWPRSSTQTSTATACSPASIGKLRSRWPRRSRSR